mmetsp:Transcript_64608/g.179163  ORF Transcript_64608/g.179163 Transcript_64608/m.179163 type:complete len:260 (-) Transcript_64608:83-862(-)
MRLVRKASMPAQRMQKAMWPSRGTTPPPRRRWSSVWASSCASHKCAALAARTNTTPPNAMRKIAACAGLLQLNALPITTLRLADPKVQELGIKVKRRRLKLVLPDSMLKKSPAVVSAVSSTFHESLVPSSEPRSRPASAGSRLRSGSALRQASCSLSAQLVPSFSSPISLGLLSPASGAASTPSSARGGRQCSSGLAFSFSASFSLRRWFSSRSFDTSSIRNLSGVRKSCSRLASDSWSKVSMPLVGVICRCICPSVSR